jgi:hypothetical protein
MRKHKSTTNLLRFPEARATQSAPTPEAKLAGLPSLYEPISRDRAVLLCEAISYRFRDDSFGLEAVLGLICAIADSEGAAERFITARTALFELTVGNLNYKRVDAYFQEAIRQN